MKSYTDSEKQKTYHSPVIPTSIGVTVTACLITALAVCLLTLLFVRKNFSKYTRLEELDAYIQKNYYLDLNDEDQEKMIDNMLKGYVAGLGDKYSQYLTPEEYEGFLTKESGKTVGIGVTVVQGEDGYPEILEVQENSPAQESGLQVGDIITAVDGMDVLEVGYTESIANIKGEENTTIKITVLRENSSLDYEITRKTFDIATAQGEMLDNQIGYIRITNFRENTVDQFLTALEELKNDGAQGFIFDVRDNGGGLLNSLEKMVDPLLPEGIIATATYHGGRTETVVESDPEELDLPMVVLVNGNSASAAELFSASLRDFKQAKLVGTQTYGKGVMQVTARTDDGGGLSLTVATYQTSRSECYQGVGLEPDVIVELPEGFAIGLSDREDDTQLAAAME
ncbi:MAG: S41 family peptidase, partial [Oscillospiraceae bacterium]|nr:S41 family peptidase [Oscillospiraceae bacterium]